MTAKKDEAAVAKKTDATVALPFDYGQDAGAGMNLTPDERLLPWLTVLQALSPAVSKGTDDGGVEGARPGMLMNSVTQELFDGKEGVIFVPSERDHEFLEWKPRKKGGGLIARHTPTDEIVKTAKAGSQKFGRYSTDYTRDDEGDFKGNDIVETFTVYGVTVDETGFCTPIAIALKSTHITPFKKWRERLLKAGRGKIPFFANLSRLRTVAQTHNGQDSFGVVLEPAVDNDVLKSLLPPDDLRYLTAKEIADQHKDGALKTHEPEQDANPGGDAMDRPAGDGGEGSIPF